MERSIKEWYGFIRNKVGFLDIYDIGILKISTLAIGLLFGSLFAKALKKLASLFAVIGAIGSAYIFIKVFLKDNVL